MTTTKQYGARAYLSEVFDPLSVAVVGATDNTGKWGYQLARGAMTGLGRRPVYLVNPRHERVLGQPTYATLKDLPAPPELVALALPVAQLPSAVEEAVEAGAKALLVVAAGLAEAGSEGRAQQEALVASVRAHGAVLVGPNCLGVVDTGAELELAWTQAGDRGLPPGPVTVISSSGNVGLELALGLRDRGVGLARFASVGNQADLTIADYVKAAAEHDETEVIALYVEQFYEPRRLFAEMTAAVDAGKQVVLVSPRGEAAARAAASHTGAMTSNAAIVESACRASGVIVGRTLGETLDIAEACAKVRSLTGLRAGVIADGGGHAVLACDALADAGMSTPTFSDALQRDLAAALDPTSLVINPIDLAAANIRVDAFEIATAKLIESGEVDLPVITGGMGSFGESIPGYETVELESARRLMRVATAAGTPILVHSMFSETSVIKAMQQDGAMVHADLSAGANAIAKVLRVRTEPRFPLQPVPDSSMVADVPRGYFESRQALASRGIRFPMARHVTSVEMALEQAEHMGFPVVLKAVDLLHKSDRGGVKVGIRNARELQASFEAMQASTESANFSVEQMVDLSNAIEFIVGARRDSSFGPVVLLGSGGVQAELFHDAQLLVWPADPAQVHVAIERLSIAPVLRGYRGGPSYDIRPLVDAAVAVASVLMSASSISDVEVNPLALTPSGAIALDARVLAD